MISAIIGLPGQGKSLSASIEMRNLIDRGYTVYSNIHLKEDRPNYHFFETKDWKIILGLQDGIIYMDEGQFILDARQWQDLPVEFRQLLQKGRHEGLDFVVLTQHIMQIDVAYRRLIFEAKKVVKVFSFKKWSVGLFLSFNAEIVQDDEVRTEMGWPDFIWATKKDWEYYDSFALRSTKPPVPDIQCECGVIHKLSTDCKH